MAYSEDHIALAAEYVLGTLDATERAQVESMTAVDADFKALVDAWDQKFAVLNQMVGSVEPRAEVWEKIRAAIRLSVQQRSPALSETTGLSETSAAPPPAQPEIKTDAAVTEAADTPPAGNASTGANVTALPQVRRWRTVAQVASALAAALVALLAIQLAQPDWLPQSLRPKPAVRIVKVQAPAAPAAAQYVALLQEAGSSPAFILTVDTATRNFTVRKIDAPAVAGHSYELWLIASKLGAPRSLGVIGASDFTARPVLASYDPETIKDATYAVTVEQQGGSPDGKPTSAPVYVGKLIETVPAPSR